MTSNSVSQRLLDVFDGSKSPAAKLEKLTALKHYCEQVLASERKRFVISKCFEECG